jgi:hypothetical protein
VAHHAELQGYYFFHYLGLDRDVREGYRDDPRFAFVEEFCAAYDQTVGRWQSTSGLAGSSASG